MTTFYLLEASQLYKQKTVDVWPKKDNTKYFGKKKNKENERNEEYSKNVGVRPKTKPEYEKNICSVRPVLLKLWLWVQHKPHGFLRTPER